MINLTMREAESDGGPAHRERPGPRPAIKMLGSRTSSQAWRIKHPLKVGAFAGNRKQPRPAAVTAGAYAPQFGARTRGAAFGCLADHPQRQHGGHR